MPPTNVSWNYQLSDNGSIAILPGVDLYIIDLDTARTAIPILRARVKDVKVICYFSAGSFEDFRVDDDRDRGKFSIRYPKDWRGVVGKKLDGWPGERWVDVRSSKVKSITNRRLGFAKTIGCDGVDPDNVDGYQNQSGFDIRKKDQIKFNRWLSKRAHKLGLAVGLKNAVELLEKLHLYYDFFINESCFTYQECQEYEIVGSNKPVFGVEYCNAASVFGSPPQDPSCYCPIANSKSFNFLIKETDLSYQKLSCEDLCQEQGQCNVAEGYRDCSASTDDFCGLL